MQHLQVIRLADYVWDMGFSFCSLREITNCFFYILDTITAKAAFEQEAVGILNSNAAAGQQTNMAARSLLQ